MNQVFRQFQYPTSPEKISLKRKREAIKTVRLHVLDRHGRAAPMTSNIAYQARSVAVPFGNCIEPSNVKAGGKGCPIRFQCAGCGFYRPDPSYLPAVEDHVRELRADRETALAMDAADFVLRNLDDQVTAFGEVADKMRQGIQALDSAEQAAVQQASTILRKMRAAATERALLPLTVLPSANGTGRPTMTDTPTRSSGEILRQARRRDSRDKRTRVPGVLDQMLSGGEAVTFAAVARNANVSTWLVYADGVREQILAARQQQARRPSARPPSRPGCRPS